MEMQTAARFTAQRSGRWREKVNRQAAQRRERECGRGEGERCETAGVAGDANVIYGREEEEVQIMAVGGRKRTRTVAGAWKQSKGSRASVVVGELMNLGDKHSRMSLRPAMDQWRGEPPAGDHRNRSSDGA